MVARVRLQIACVAVACTMVAGEAWAQLCRPRWEPLGAGVGGPDPWPAPYAVLEYDDGSGSALYVGGGFSEAGNRPAQSIARWDGQDWVPVGPGLGGRRYGIPPWVRALLAHDDGTGTALYAGGRFQTAGTTPVENIACWDGARWRPVGTGLEHPSHLGVLALVEFDDGSGRALYAGGDFLVAGSVNASYIARWDGVQWTRVPDARAQRVMAMRVFDDGAGPALYVAQTTSVRRWDGVTWSDLGELGGGIGTSPRALHRWEDAGHGPALLVGGQFDVISGRSIPHLGALDRSGWRSVDWPTSQPCRSLAEFDAGVGRELYGLTSIGDILVWTGQGWSRASWSPAAAGKILQVVEGGRAMLAGGVFERFGGIEARNIARLVGCAGTCYADCDGDGQLTFLDLLCFQSAFLAGDPNADCDGSGRLDLFDFLCFQNEFLAGCP